ncbi:MAG TPA: PaaX family transcriptional regulator C-terminal domain-containing protein [Acidimicrobiales bacterium]|nr:PaaX family transcriptional regulator C-terminal domain-containing protein [Acidimicrobiales bacterium]
MSRTTVQVPTRVLVFGMTRADHTILPSEVIPVAEACGQSPDQIRSCLRRLVTEGLFLRRGSGRDAVYEATPAGLAAMGTTMERTRLAYVQDAAGRGWDRQWRLVGFAVPERNRSARDAFRERLLALGGSAVQGGLYVSPHPWHKDVRAEAERLGLADQVSLATTDDLEVGGERDPRELARRLWQLDDLASRYRRFTDTYGGIPAELTALRERHERLADATFLPLALGMAVAFSECFGRDPLLPPELLPRPWPGREARELTARSRRQALALRQANGLPPLFRLFDEAIEAIP